MDTAVTLSLSDEIFEALARRTAEILREQVTEQRFMDAEAAARYTGIPVKTVRTKSWRDQESVPYEQLSNGRLVFDRFALDRRFAGRATQVAQRTLPRGEVR